MAEFNPRNNGDVNAAFALLELLSVPSVAPSSLPGSRSPSSWSSSEESGSNASHTTHSHHHHHHHHHEANHQHCHHHEQYDHKQQAVLCRADRCVLPPIGGLQFCRDHAGPRHCQFPPCTKCAQFNTPFCEAHGSNGKRCVYPGCNKSAREKDMCSTHGGVKRCIFNGCSKLAMTGSIACGHHGGGRRCQFYNCSRSAQSSTLFCVRHGGGRKCHIKGCQKITRGCDDFCTGHGGGIRCRVEGCRKAAIGKLRMCRGHAGLPKKHSSARAMKDQMEQSKMMMGMMTEGVGEAVAAVAFQQPEPFMMRSQEVDDQPAISMDAANFNVELSATTSISPPAAAMWQAPPSSTSNEMAASFVSDHASKPTALPFLPACGISMNTAVVAAVAAANTMNVSSSLVASVSFPAAAGAAAGAGEEILMTV